MTETKAQVPLALDADIQKRCDTAAEKVGASRADIVRRALVHPRGLAGVEKDIGVRVVAGGRRRTVAGPKKATVIALEPEVRDRCDALRVVLAASRAEVIREALRGNGLGQLEQAQAERLGRLQALAVRRGHPTWREFVRALVLAGDRGHRSLPTLEALENPAAAQDQLPVQPGAKLSPAEVTAILAARTNGETLAVIAARYRVSESMVSRICSGKRRAA